MSVIAVMIVTCGLVTYENFCRHSIWGT